MVPPDGRAPAVTRLGRRPARKSGIALIFIGLAGLVFWFGYYRNADAQSPPPSINGNCNVFGNNNVNCNTFNVGPVQRHLSDADKADILARIPKTRNISIMTQTGDSDAADLSGEIKSFLVSSGYFVDGPNYALMFGPNGSPRGVNINLNQDKPTEPVTITVGTR